MLVNYEKENGVYKRYSELPLTARPLDLLYFLFFAVCTVLPQASSSPNEYSPSFHIP